MSEQSMLIFNILDLFHNFSLQSYKSLPDVPNGIELFFVTLQP